MAQEKTKEQAQEDLRIAARIGDLGKIKAAISAGADSLAEDANGWIALHLVSALGSTDCLRELIKYGGRRAQDGRGYTPLMCACSGVRRDENALLLLGEGEELMGSEGETALMIACEAGASPKLVSKLLAREGAKTERNNRGAMAIHLAAGKAPVETLRLLADPLFDLAADNYGKNPLMCAIAAKAPENTRLLANPISARFSSHVSGMTPLMEAARHGFAEGIAILRNFLGEEDFALRDVKGQTALHWAADSEDMAVLGVLAELCPLGAQTAKGKSARMLAKECGRAEGERFLGALEEARRIAKGLAGGAGGAGASVGKIRV